MAGSEVYRVEIPIIVDDQTDKPLQQAEQKISKLEQHARKENERIRQHFMKIAKLQIEPVMKVRDQLTSGVLKADRLIRKLDMTQASPLIAAQDRVSAVVTRINAMLDALDKGKVDVIADMKGPLLDEIVKAKSALAVLNNVKAGPIAELRGELFGQLTKAMSQIKGLDLTRAEPQATLRERVTWKVKEISSSLRDLTSRTWNIILQAKDKASGIINNITSGVRRAVSLLTSPLALLGVGGGIGGLTKLGIDMVVERENITMAFETLLGSADAARKRVEELTKFAGQTPFSRDDIYESSRILEVFTRGALSTSKGLKLVGDVAAGTKQEYKEVALWIGRLYDAMASGRPVGEMTARLQEMGAISGEQRAKLEQLAKSGKKISQTWPEAEKIFSRFEGQMEKMSHGLGNMLLSTKSFFRENVIYRWGKGVESVIGPLLTRFREWRQENPEKVQAMGDKIESVARTCTENVVEFFERAFGRISKVIESPEFDRATFGEKVQMLVEAGLEDVITWLEGPGMKKLEDVFIKLGETSINAYLAGMKLLGVKAIEKLKEGDLKGAAVPALAMWFLGGGALLKAGWGIGKTVGKGVLTGGRKVMQTKPMQALATRTKTALFGQDLVQISKSAGTATQATAKAAKNTTKAAAQTVKATKQVVGISKSASQAAKSTAKTASKAGILKGVSKVAGRVALPLAIGLEAYDIYKAQDKVKATAKAGGGLGGAALGAKAGAAVGTMILPGIGTVVGGLIGGAGGYLAGSFAGGKAVDVARGRGTGAQPAYAAAGGGASTRQYLEQEVYEPFREYVNRAESWGRNLIGNFMRGRDSAGMSMRGWLNNLLYEPFREYVNRAESWGRNLIGNFMRGRDSAGMSMTGWLNYQVYESFRSIVNRAESWGRNLIGNFMRGRDSAGMSMSGWLNSQVYEPFRSIVNRAESWGRNMMKNFVKGMQQVPIPAPKVPAPVYTSTPRKTGNMLKHAAGGILTRPHLALVAEAGPEAIIPLSERMRNQALKLWEQTGQILGVKPYALGGFAGPVPAVAAAGGYGGSISIINNVNVSVSVGDSSGDTASAREIAEEVADEIAMKISSIFQNMPLRG